MGGAQESTLRELIRTANPFKIGPYMGVFPPGCYLRVDQSTRVLTLKCNNKALIKD